MSTATLALPVLAPPASSSPSRTRDIIKDMIVEAALNWRDAIDSVSEVNELDAEDKLVDLLDEYKRPGGE